MSEPRPTGRLIGKRSVPPPSASPAEPPAPRLGQPQITYPRSDWCQACQRTTTHVRQGCTRCMGKGDNRRQGLLWALIGGVILVFGLGWVTIGPLLARKYPGRRTRFSAGWIAWVMLATGGSLTAKGVRALITGSDPEAEI